MTVHKRGGTRNRGALGGHDHACVAMGSGNIETCPRKRGHATRIGMPPDQRRSGGNGWGTGYGFGRTYMSRASIACIALAAVVCWGPGCRRTSSVDPSSARPVPAADREVTPPPEPPDVPEAYEELLNEDRPRWLVVEKLREGKEGGWATGHFVEEANKIVIDTDGVERFTLHLDRLELNWTLRVVLRIDGSNSELTRKHYPTLRLRRTSGGSWEPVTN